MGRKEQTGTSVRKTPQTDLQTYTRQHINSAYKSWGKKNKKDTGKLQKDRQSLYQHNIERKTKEGAQTKYKNNKTIRRHQSNKKEQ